MCLLLEQLEFYFWSKGIGGLLGILLDAERSRCEDVTAGIADAECIGAGLGDPLAACLVVAGEVAHGDGHRERLALAGLQLARLGEGFLSVPTNTDLLALLI